jgi:hypothetical protein
MGGDRRCAIYNVGCASCTCYQRGCGGAIIAAKGRGRRHGGSGSGGGGEDCARKRANEALSEVGGRITWHHCEEALLRQASLTHYSCAPQHAPAALTVVVITLVPIVSLPFVSPRRTLIAPSPPAPALSRPFHGYLLVVSGPCPATL